MNNPWEAENARRMRADDLQDAIDTLRRWFFALMVALVAFVAAFTVAHVVVTSLYSAAQDCTQEGC